jgi:hypothetical protein
MPWSEIDKNNWFKEQKVQRSYIDHVVSKIEKLRARFEIHQYGALSINPDLYPLYVVKSEIFELNKKTILITGGVHGYETSGVHGALAFFERVAEKYDEKFNFICAPCISPWSYETINRWNNKAIDPNRSFYKNSPAEECQFFLAALSPYENTLYAHFDLHETTDTDNSVFLPALEKRDGIKKERSETPDGFYLVGNTGNPQKDFQAAIIAAVKKVTHIAPADKEGQIIGVALEQPGVINYDLKKLSLCAGFSNAPYTTTTEVYPDSPKITDAICVDAQVAAVEGGLNYLLQI